MLSAALLLRVGTAASPLSITLPKEHSLNSGMHRQSDTQ
jgi:hypothetical protein